MMDVKKCFTAFAVVLLALLIVIFVGVILSRTVMDTYDPHDDWESIQSSALTGPRDIPPENFSECSSELLMVGGKLFYRDHIDDNYCYVSGYFAKSRIKNTFADLELTESDWETFKETYWENYGMNQQ